MQLTADFYQVGTCLSQRVKGFAFLWSESLTWVMLQASLNEILANADTTFLGEFLQFLPVLFGTAKECTLVGVFLIIFFFLAISKNMIKGMNINQLKRRTKVCEPASIPRNF